MTDWKRTINRILYPPVWLMILLAAASGVLLPMIFLKGWEESPVAYVVYVLAFYTVTVLCIFCTMIVPKWYRGIRQTLYANSFGNRYMTDAAFKVQVSLHISLAINLAYSAFQLLSGILYASLWIGAVAVYYILLSVIRFVLLYHMHRKQDAGLVSEYKSCRLSAILMMLMNLTLSGIVLNMIVKNEAAVYSDIFVIASATYTFYILAMSIKDLIQYRKYQSPVMSSAKAIRFAQALVSLLSLEADMLVQFGDDETFRRWMLALTGAGVCIIVLSMSVYMILQSTKEMKRLQAE